MPDTFIKSSVYSDFLFMQDLLLDGASGEGADCSRRLAQGQDLPGCRLEVALAAVGTEDQNVIQQKLEQACRKLCMMWYAAKMVLDAEREFYATAVQEAPVLSGEKAVRVKFSLDTFVMLARAALDTGAGVFGRHLPDPFPRDRYENFGDLVKKCLNPNFKIEVSPYFDGQRGDVKSWLSIVLGAEKGRAGLEKLTHQMEFPWDYQELRPWATEKRQAVVWVDGDHWLELEQFVGRVCSGVLYAFSRLEDLCLQHLSSAAGRQAPRATSRRLPLRA
jgi:hypothetical protein